MENKIIDEQKFTNGDVEQVKELLDNGWVIPVSYRDQQYNKEYSSPLLATIKFGNGNIDMIDFLLNQDINVNWTDCYGKNALYYTIMLGFNIDIIDRLLNKGALLPEEYLPKNIRAEVFFRLVNTKNKDIIDHLFTTDQFDCNSVWKGKTLLMHAVETGDLNIVKCLIGVGANVNNTIEGSANIDTDDDIFESDYKSSPLALAIENDYEDIVQYLLSLEGIDINIPFGTRERRDFISGKIIRDYIYDNIDEYVEQYYDDETTIKNLFTGFKSKRSYYPPDLDKMTPC